MKNAIHQSDVERSGLLGTPETCIKTVEHLISAGVNEVACLIDFGVEADLVLPGLQYIKQVKELANSNVSADTGTRIGGRLRQPKKPGPGLNCGAH